MYTVTVRIQVRQNEVITVADVVRLRKAFKIDFTEEHTRNAKCALKPAFNSSERKTYLLAGFCQVIQILL